METRELGEKPDRRRAGDDDCSEKERRMKLAQFLLPLLLDQDESAQDFSREKKLLLEEKAASLGIRCFPAESPCYMVLSIGFWGNHAENLTDVEHLIFTDSIFKKYVRCGTVLSIGKIISVISAERRDMEKYVHALTEDLLESAKKHWGLRCSIGVSRDFSSIFMSSVAYSEAVAAMHCVPADANGVQFIAEMDAKEFLKFESIEEAVAELDQIIKTGSRIELEKFLAGLFARVHGEKEMRGSRVLLGIQILDAVYRAVSMSLDKNVLAEIIAPFSVLEKGFSKRLLDEAYSKMLHLCRQAQDIVAAHREVRSELLSNRVVSLIETGFSDETMTLISLSEQLHISYSYLSATIKKTTGETFVSLLTKKRMEKAREYLLCTSMKILEISALCGYSDQRYFSSCFKKYFGESPSKLREGARHTEER